MILIWEASDHICGKRLQAALPNLVSSMERHWISRCGKGCLPPARLPWIVC